MILNGLYVVQMRRGARFPMRPGAEQLEGRTFRFREGWQLKGEEGGRYAGELAMVSIHDDPEHPYPDDAPVWIPFKDLQRARTEEPLGDLLEQAKA